MINKLQTICLQLLTPLLILMPSLLFFSYYPVIHLADTSTMHLELSIPLLALAISAVLVLPLLPKIFPSLPSIIKIIAAIIPCYTIISLIWSNNPLRTFLSAAILTCLTLVILSLPYIVKHTPNFPRRTLRLFLITSAAVCLIAWLQSLLDTFSISREYTLLCQGCTYHSFGFPHPSAFAIEPQFFGNLLLAPTFLTYYLILQHKSQKSQDILPSYFLLPLALFLTTTLFFTFSRGAIYAFLAALALFLCYQLAQRNFRPHRLLLPLVLGSAVLALLCQGLFAQLSPTSDTFLTGITKSIHHMTLGKIDLRPSEITPASPSESVPTSTSESAPAPSSHQSEPNPDTQPTAPPKEQSSFSGYVAESTETRTNLTKMALITWRDSPLMQRLLGYGLGSAGPVLYQHYPDALGTPQQIVQNEYASLLLEYGLLGLALVIIVLVTLFKTIKITSTPQLSWLLTLLFAYALTLWFFSGLPNALHIYLLPFYAILFSKHQPLIN